MDDANPTFDGPDPAARPVRAFRRLTHVRRAFGTPIEQDGVTLVPVARVMGGTGFGGGGGADGASEDGAASSWGSGGGLGVRVSPVGVYVVSGGQVRWEPAIDVGRIVMGAQVVLAVAVLAVARARRRRR